MNKRKAIIISTVVLILIGAGAWAFGFFKRSDPAIAELQQIGSQMWDRSLSDAQRNQMRDEFRQKMDSLTDDQRRAFFDANRDKWMGQMQKNMDDFFKMSKADQQKRLDEIIDRMVKSRNSQQQNGNQANTSRNRGNRGNTTDAQCEERAKRRLDRTTPTMRAQFAEFRKQLDNRAQQRGISIGDPGRGFGGDFGRGPRGT